MKVLFEGERGCGYRKQGGLYMMGGAGFAPCCKLPAELTVCPCCNQGIKFTRGFQWITTDLFFPVTADWEARTEPDDCRKGFCILSKPGKRIGLMWVGEATYPTPRHFVNESIAQGVSRRIGALPRGAVPGETQIALAHRKAFSRVGENGIVTFTAGVFMVFLLKEVQYVVTGQETPEELEKLAARGIEPVEVRRANEQANFDFKG